MRFRNPLLNSGWSWLVVTAGCIACSGSSSKSSATGGAQNAGVGGTSQTQSETGGTSIVIGDTLATGGALASGGTTASGNSGGTFTSATGGVVATGGGTQSTAGASSAGGGTGVAGRGAGICPGGSYPAPDLSGSALVVTSSTDSGQYEGTLWLDSKGVLLFSGMNTSATGVVPATVNQLTPPSTVTTPVADSGTNGLAIDFNGNILGGSQKVQGIVTVNLTAGTVTTLVNTDASGKHFNSVNDLTVRTDGTIYFTDPDYQLGGRSNETGIKGVYRFSPSKQVALVDGQFNQPNGISLSPDETILYVADTAANRIRKFAVAADGSTSGKTDFATVSSPDGGAIDCAGNLYWASNAAPGKVVVLTPSGSQLGTISLGTSDKPTNVAFGGADHKTLYVSTSPRKIYAVALNIPGFPY